ncbi:GNAT family N-acetyltransferase [Blastococcus sp. TF02-8]|uniref:GNAT family N-acetyltransferase n=1 Tax=Blastococcus sp. TF02-8 TaxID=2250574 RepID=UPI001412A604
MTGPVLRVPTDDDAARWSALFDDAEVMRFIGSGEVRERAYYDGLVERQQELAEHTGLCLFSVVVDGEVAGFAGIHPWSHPWGPTGSLEAGWRLGRRFWGRGVATAAVRSAVDLARSRAVLRLVSMIHAENAASVAVARKLGMTRESVHRSPDGAPVHQFGLAFGSPVDVSTRRPVAVFPGRPPATAPSRRRGRGDPPRRAGRPDGSSPWRTRGGTRR